ncbi:MAG: hypothetical protein HC853_03995 [Anaerolineae bacterium]|nr:hypothetical protein [Anaerolineae bacterium]
MTDTKLTGLEFTGNWIGETMSQDGKAESRGHLWEIKRSNDTLIIGTRWEGELVQSGYFSAKVPYGSPSFELRTDSHTFMATLVDSQHFIIRDWDTNDVRNNQGRNYDVVFSRPGLAELNAQEVWQQHKAKLPKAKKVPKRKPPKSAASKLASKAKRKTPGP